MIDLELPDGWQLVQTSVTCPEQYDLVDDRGRQVAYLRLRWGVFTVEVPDCRGQLVLRHQWPDEPLMGAFADDDQRSRWLARAMWAIRRA